MLFKWKMPILITGSIFLVSVIGGAAWILNSESTPNINANESDNIPANFTEYVPTIDDTKTDWDESATKIVLSGDSASITGDGVITNGSTITITTAGTYIISGVLDNGQILISATKNDQVRLVLNGVSITNKTGAPIYGEKIGKLIVTLADGMDNTLTDGGINFVYEDTQNEEPNAALFCKNDLTLNGNGSLTVNAGFNNGIGAKDNLLIVSGNYTVVATNNAVRGTDSVTSMDGRFNLIAGNDGIQTGNNTDGKGNIKISGGVYSIKAGHDGIQSDAAMLITGGEYTITSGGGSSEKVSSSSESYKGVKSTRDLTFSGNVKFTIDSLDDSIHSNENITISDGIFQLSSGDDGVHADGDLKISGGEITISKSYEGLEGSNVNIMGGTLNLIASDDGINAAGGSSNGIDIGSGRFGGDRFGGDMVGSYSISINGGSITLYAGGDGLDSNGAIDISGGTVVSIINSSGNSALDSDGLISINGGVVIAGGTGTFENIGSGSTQSYVYLSGISSGSEILVKKSSKTLVSYTTDKALSHLTIFSPDIKNGTAYDISVNGQTTSVTAGTGGGRNMGGGMGVGNNLPGEGGKRP